MEVATCVPHPAQPSEEELVNTLWYSPEELHKIRLREASVIVGQAKCEQYLEQVYSVMEMAAEQEDTGVSTCGSSTCSNSFSSSKQEEDQGRDDNDCDEASSSSSNSSVSSIDTTAPLFVARSEARGLEREVLACFRQRRKQVIRDLLKAQTALKSWRGDKQQVFSLEFQQKALSQHYQRLARPSVRFAQILADGDADLTNIQDLPEDRIVMEDIEVVDDLSAFEW
jgi:hypothetical protein